MCYNPPGQLRQDSSAGQLRRTAPPGQLRQDSSARTVPLGQLRQDSSAGILGGQMPKNTRPGCQRNCTLGGQMPKNTSTYKIDEHLAQYTSLKHA